MHLKSRRQQVLRGCRHSPCSCSCTDPLFYEEPMDGTELELGSSQAPACYPQSGHLLSNTSHLAGVNGLDESLQRGHPAGGQVAVLEEDPVALLHGTVQHGFSTGALQRHRGRAQRPCPMARCVLLSWTGRQLPGVGWKDHCPELWPSFAPMAQLDLCCLMAQQRFFTAFTSL